MKNDNEKRNIRVNHPAHEDSFLMPKHFAHNALKLSDEAFCLGMYLYYRIQNESNTMPNDKELTEAARMERLGDTLSAKTELIDAGVLAVLPDSTFKLLDEDLLREDTGDEDGDYTFTPAAFVDFPISLIQRMPEMSADAVCVALYLRYFEDYEESIFLPSDARIGTAAGLSTSAAKRARKELIDKGILFVDTEDRLFEIDCGISHEEGCKYEDWDEDEDEDGEAACSDDIYAELGLTKEEVEASLKQLSDLGLTHKRHDGSLSV